MAETKSKGTDFAILAQKKRTMSHKDRQRKKREDARIASERSNYHPNLDLRTEGSLQFEDMSSNEYPTMNVFNSELYDLSLYFSEKEDKDNGDDEKTDDAHDNNSNFYSIDETFSSTTSDETETYLSTSSLKLVLLYASMDKLDFKDINSIELSDLAESNYQTLKKQNLLQEEIINLDYLHINDLFEAGFISSLTEMNDLGENSLYSNYFIAVGEDSVDEWVTLFFGTAPLFNEIPLSMLPKQTLKEIANDTQGRTTKKGMFGIVEPIGGDFEQDYSITLQNKL